MVNLESSASAMQKPKIAPRFGLGSSAQTSIARKAAPRYAASPMSVVASPACARTVGISVKQKRGDHTGGERRSSAVPSRYTTRQPSTKNGRLPSPHERHGLFRMLLVGNQLPAFQLKGRLCLAGACRKGTAGARSWRASAADAASRNGRRAARHIVVRRRCAPVRRPS